MATIKPIEGKSIHQIQSGQVIVDLSSVVKELVENSLDAGATSIEVRFRNNGLDAIEVQDNGTGIAPEDFESIALKHHTSKLSTYDDLGNLQTFGFRGEALSSLCALSDFHVVTARGVDGPKGTKLEFDVSGKLAGKSVVASQKGTTISVENIFRNLPVRRKELDKNIKREYGKVLGLLHAYACISTGIRFSVSNQVPKGKKVIVFSTKANPTTRENISNVYGAKTLLALLPLNLKLELQPALVGTQSVRNWNTRVEDPSREIQVTGHISRPVVGEGRQAPDRQMFFVNCRPCALPQVAKAINEVYKSYNVTQSPFIFANLRMNTNAYDVNVSPDKRTILLHDQTALLESLKTSLTELFEGHDQSVPQAQLGNKKLPTFRPLTVTKPLSTEDDAEQENQTSHGQDDLSDDDGELENPTPIAPPGSILRRFMGRDTVDPEVVEKTAARSRRTSKDGGKAPQVREPESEEAADNAALPKPLRTTNQQAPSLPEIDSLKAIPGPDAPTNEQETESMPLLRAVQDFNNRMASQLQKRNEPDAAAQDGEGVEESEILSVSPMPKKTTPGVVQNAFDRMRPKRTPAETATVTIGDKTTIMTIGTPEAKRRRIHTPKFSLNGQRLSQSSPAFAKCLRAFAAPGTQFEDEEDEAEAASVVLKAEPPANTGQEATTSSMGLTEDAEMLDVEAPEPVSLPNPALFLASDDASDDEYMDEEEKKRREETKIAKMIAQAEEAAARPTADNLKRAASALKGRVRRDSTLQLIQYLETSVHNIERKLSCLTDALQDSSQGKHIAVQPVDGDAMDESAEDRLSLTVSKGDFARMRIIGQFNLGFILAARPAASPTGNFATARDLSRASDELFIIDQHASDEKYNFERLQAETIVQNQRLVHPRHLDLTAVEEEIILNHPDALVKNGFLVSTDESGDTPVGQRCSLTSIPMSKEVVFNHLDLEELLSLLADYSGGSDIPRPSKVRRMFAMRACRSSIMVGKSLSMSKMEKVVRNLGGLDKPWNCPHGRPTMRHLFGLDDWTSWSEGDGLAGMGKAKTHVDWEAYAGETSGTQEEDVADQMFEDDPSDWLFAQRR